MNIKKMIQLREIINNPPIDTGLSSIPVIINPNMADAFLDHGSTKVEVLEKLRQRLHEILNDTNTNMNAEPLFSEKEQIFSAIVRIER